MEFFRIRRTIHFMRFDKIFNTISFISFLIAVFLVCTRGLAFSIEFTGGTVMEVTYPQAAPTEQIREQIKTSLGVEAAVQNFECLLNAVGCTPEYNRELLPALLGETFSE